jgi:flagellar FliJ protein
MPFRFTLQAVLRWRESFERRERLRLAMITRETLKARRERDEAKLERGSSIAEFQSKLQRGMNSAEMQFELASDRARQRRIASLIDHFSKLEYLRRQQLEVFRKAQQQRKILENLRDRQLATYQLILARRLQQEMDERFLLTQRWKSAES